MVVIRFRTNWLKLAFPNDAGRVRYAWQTGDTDTPGTFQGEFEVTYSTGEIETFPNDGFLAIEIIDDIV